MGHYFDKHPQVRHDRSQTEENIRGVELRFVTDAGVFSKQGVDFGSKLLIENLDLPPQGHFLDMGCGYGPIGLFMAKLYPSAVVTMLDINERAVQLATENAISNNLHNVDCEQSDLYEKVEARLFDAIVTNPPIRAGKQTVFRIYEEAIKHLKPGGTLWIVIQKKQGAPSTLTKLQSLFPHVEELAKRKGYYIFRAQKG